MSEATESCTSVLGVASKAQAVKIAHAIAGGASFATEATRYGENIGAGSGGALGCLTPSDLAGRPRPGGGRPPDRLRQPPVELLEHLAAVLRSAPGIWSQSAASSASSARSSRAPLTAQYAKAIASTPSPCRRCTAACSARRSKGATRWPWCHPRRRHAHTPSRRRRSVVRRRRPSPPGSPADARFAVRRPPCRRSRAGARVRRPPCGGRARSRHHRHRPRAGRHGRSIDCRRARHPDRGRRRRHAGVLPHRPAPGRAELIAGVSPERALCYLRRPLHGRGDIRGGLRLDRERAARCCGRCAHGGVRRPGLALRGRAHRRAAAGRRGQWRRRQPSRSVPALSFCDLAWGRLGIDPLAAGVRLVDGLSFARAGGRRPRPAARRPVLVERRCCPTSSSPSRSRLPGNGPSSCTTSGSPTSR